MFIARPAMQCTDGDLRLAAGYGLSEGYPQLCVNGEWISFCHNTWGTQLSERFCQWVFGRTDMGKELNVEFTKSVYHQCVLALCVN